MTRWTFEIMNPILVAITYGGLAIARYRAGRSFLLTAPFWSLVLALTSIAVSITIERRDGIENPLMLGELSLVIAFFVVMLRAVMLILIGNKTRISRAPGWGLHRLASCVFSKRTFEQVIEQPLSDLQRDYFEALDEERPIKARWAQVRGYYCFWTHFVLQIPFELLRILWKIGEWVLR